ncbi:MAG: cation:dicarboxylase symporter family transporter, partial [Rhodothermaceae bacterium]|nr:cation:dicarboxylase symporter family transporter [Rhodothermaceae bacterium]
MSWYRKLHWQILIGLFLGLIWGLIASQTGMGAFTLAWIKPFGTIFVNLLKLIAIPLVLASLVVGVAKLNDITKLSRMGGKTIILYLITSVFAITIGLTVVNIMKPGKALPMETREELMMSYQDNVGDRGEVAGRVLEREPLQPLVDIFPENFVDAASDNSNMLQVVFIAIILGIGIIQIE